MRKNIYIYIYTVHLSSCQKAPTETFRRTLGLQQKHLNASWIFIHPYLSKFTTTSSLPRDENPQAPCPGMPRPPGCCSSHGVEYLQSADRLKPQSPSGEYEHREFRWFTRQNYWIHQYVCRSNELFCVWYAIGIKMAWYRYRHPKNLNFYSKQMINPRNSGTCSCQLILQMEIV